MVLRNHDGRRNKKYSESAPKEVFWPKLESLKISHWNNVIIVCSPDDVPDEKDSRPLMHEVGDMRPKVVFQLDQRDRP